MRCPNCQTTNPPQAKFCMECGTRLHGCTNCGTVNPPQAKFCIECGHPFTASLQPIVPKVQKAEVLPHSEERRIVTVMFADITGSTPLADRLDPEDMRAILTGYFNLMTQQIRKHDGTVEKYIGDAVMAVFGAPVTHEDDPERAIRAALDMQYALHQFNEQRLAHVPLATRLQMRIGINTGEVAAPSGTATQHHDFLITGDAVNIAARLQQAATPDTILVGERTYQATKDVFEFKFIAPLQLKGKAEALNAYVVHEKYQHMPIITQHPRGIAGRQTPMVGRSLELTLLHASYARVQAERRPHLITILGSPGVGKTRLVREFITREQELIKSASAQEELVSPLVLKGRCPPYGEGITYWPLIEILRALIQAQENEREEALQQRFVDYLRDLFTKTHKKESPEEIADTLLRRIGKSLNTTERRSKLQNYTTIRSKPDTQENGNTTTIKTETQGAILRAWRVLLEALGEIQPLIIVVDDIQWADEALLDLLEYLTNRITAIPILFLCPARPDFLEQRRDWGGGHRNFTAIELESLSWEDSSNLVDALLDKNELPEALRYAILTRAEGNPFFVEEIVRMFIDQGILIQGEDQEQGWRIHYPNQAMLEELEQVPEYHEDGVMNSNYFYTLPHVPDTIQGVLAARVDLLDPLEKQVLQYAAIIGRSFWLSSVKELAKGFTEEVVLNALMSLVKRGFILEIDQEKIISLIEDEDRVFSFKHILTREVVYNNIPRQRRVREHAHIALWLDAKTGKPRDTIVELIANHYQQALSAWSLGSAIDVIDIELTQDQQVHFLQLSKEDLRNRAVTYLTRTGDLALHSHYPLRALRAFSDAFELIRNEQTPPLLRSTMLTKLGDAYTLRGNLDDAWQQYRRALQLAQDEGIEPDKKLLLRIYEKLSLVATRWLSHFDTRPDPQEIWNYIHAGLQILAGKPISREHIAFLTYQAFWYIRQLNYAEPAEKRNLATQAMTSGQEALKLAEELGNARTLSLTLDAMGFIYFQYHRYNKAKELQERRLQLESLITEREEIYDLYASLGATSEQVSDYATALTYYGRAWSYANTMENPGMVLSSMVGRMRVWHKWNRWDNAEQVAHEILQFIEKYQQDEKRQLWALETLATIAYHRGHTEEGDQYASQYRRLLDLHVERTRDDNQVLIESKLHAISHAQGDWKRATAAYEEKLRYSEPFPAPAILATLAELLLITETTPEEQQTLIERAITVCEEAGERKSLGVSLRARGRFYLQQQSWEKAEETLRRSLECSEKLDLPWEKGHTLYYLGLLYHKRAQSITVTSPLRQSDIGRAQYYLEQALGFYESLRAIPAIERVHQALKAHDELTATIEKSPK